MAKKKSAVTSTKKQIIIEDQFVPKLTEDNIIDALYKYVEVFNAGTPRHLGFYVSPDKMSYGAFKLHFDALKAAIEIVIGK